MWRRRTAAAFKLELALRNEGNKNKGILRYLLSHEGTESIMTAGTLCHVSHERKVTQGGAASPCAL